MLNIVRSFFKGYHDLQCLRCRKEKKMRHKMEEYRIDNMIDDSFPASDPPSTY